MTTSALALAAAGDRIVLREACIAARHEGGVDYATSLEKAEFVVFPDGERRYPDGSVAKGKRPPDRDQPWVTAMHMPFWAARVILIVEWRRAERLHAITRADILAEGAVPFAGGLLWRWPKPVGGPLLPARGAFARWWNIGHATPGERWQDDPAVLVLGLRPAD